jgi:mttA/Hcf106 family
MTTLPGFIAGWMPGPIEAMFLLTLGVILFGRKLPEVGRSLGRGIDELGRVWEQGPEAKIFIVIAGLFLTLAVAIVRQLIF